MRYLFILLGCLLLLGNPLRAGEKKGHHITIKIKGLVSDTLCYLYMNYGDRQRMVDTVEIGSDGQVEFVGEEVLPEGAYLVVVPDLLAFQMLVDRQVFSIQTDIKDLVLNAKVKGSFENEIFYEYQKKGREHIDKSEELKRLLEKHKSNADSLKIIQEQVRAFNVERYEYNESFIEKYPNTFFVKMLIATKPIVPQEPPEGYQGSAKDFKLHYMQKHFFDNVDLSDERFVRTDIIHAKIFDYISQYTAPYPDSITKSIDFILNIAKSDEVYNYIISALFGKYNKIEYIGNDVVFVHIAENYYMNGKVSGVDSAFVSEISKKVMELRPALPGGFAQNLPFLDTAFIPVPLYSVEAELCIVLFYEPDCSHCKKFTGELKGLYDKYRDQGVKVYAVCTKTDIDEWKKFIKERNLNWINVADPYYTTNFRYYFDVRGTPKTFVLDKNKLILLNRHIGIEQLEKFVISRLSLKNKKE